MKRVPTDKEMELAQRLRLVRIYRRQSVAMVSKGMGIKACTYYGKECGTTRISAIELFRLAKLLRVSIDSFFYPYIIYIDPGDYNYEFNEVMLGVNLRGVRKDRELSSEQMMNLLNISRITIHRWETGKVTIDATCIKEWADICGVNINTLFAPIVKEGVYIEVKAIRTTVQ